MEQNFGSWSVLTTNFLIVLYIALGGITLCSILQLVNGDWRFQIRRLACALSVLFPIAFVMLLVLLANGEATFPWLASAHDEGTHLGGWHNYTFLVVREIGAFLFVAAFCGLFIKYQYQSDIDTSYKAQRRYRNIALLLPFVYFSYGSLVAWDFEMTLIPGWHSASYAAYHFQSGFHMFLAFFTIFLFFLGRSGKLTQPFDNHIYNYMAQFMFAMTILWTYFYFTQYLIMWYARLPFEMGRFDGMMYEGLSTLWWAFLIFKFVIPFVTFVFTPNRHNPPLIVAVAVSILVGSWLERYTWISGSLGGEAPHMPMTSLFDIVVTLGVITVCWLAVKWSLTRYNLVKS